MSDYPPEFDVERASRQLRIGIVYGRLPVPMRRADQMTVAHLTAFLTARGHEVSVMTLDTGASASAQDYEWIRAHSARAAVLPHSRLAQVFGAARAWLAGKPAQVGVFTSSRLRQLVEQRALDGQFDVIYVYYFRSADSVSAATTAAVPSVLAMQLSQTLNTRRIRANAPGLITRLFYEVESRWVARYETQVWRRFARVALIGEQDVAAINAETERRGLSPLQNVILSPHGTDVKRFAPASDDLVEPGLVVFSGVMRTPTNIQAVQWFVKNVWPLVRERHPEARFTIVGREPSSEVLALASTDHNIVVTGTVPDPAAYIAQATLCVNPMQAGGGMQNKLIEYLASGKAVVATSVANEGVAAPPGAILIGNSAEEFADLVSQCLDSPQLRIDLGASGRSFVEQNWTWEHHFYELEEHFYKLAPVSTGRKR